MGIFDIFKSKARREKELRDYFNKKYLEDLLRKTSDLKKRFDVIRDCVKKEESDEELLRVYVLENEKSESFFYVTNENNFLYFRIGLINNPFINNPRTSSKVIEFASNSIDRIVNIADKSAQKEFVDDTDKEMFKKDYFNEDIINLFEKVEIIEKEDEVETYPGRKSDTPIIKGDAVYLYNAFVGDIYCAKQWAEFPGFEKEKKFTVLDVQDITRKDLNEILTQQDIAKFNSYKTSFNKQASQYPQKFKKLRERNIVNINTNQK